MDVLQRDACPHWSPRSFQTFQHLPRRRSATQSAGSWKKLGMGRKRHRLIRIATRTRNPRRIEVTGPASCRLYGKCRHDTGLTVGTVMERSHMPVSTWFWAAYLVPARRPGISGGSRFSRVTKTWRQSRTVLTVIGRRCLFSTSALNMVRPGNHADRIGGKPGEHVEIDETWVGGRPDSRRRPGCPPQGSRRLCRRGSSSETGNRAGQAKGRTLAGRVRLP